MPDWPQKVSNFSLFKDSIDLMGIGTITLPNIVNITDTFRGGGYMGETDVPNQCHFGPMSIAVDWHVAGEHCMELAAQEGLTLDCWAAPQYHNSGLNRLNHKGWRFFFSTLPKGVNLGTLEVGGGGSAGNELEIYAVRGIYNDRERIHIDKEAFICRINGVDYARRIRQLIGRE